MSLQIQQEPESWNRPSLQGHRHRLSRQAWFGNLGIFPFLLASTLVPKIQFPLKSWKSQVPILRGISHGQSSRSRPNEVQLRWFPKRKALGNCCQQSHSWEASMGYIQRPLQRFADERENTRQLRRAMEGRSAQTYSRWGQKSGKHLKIKAFHLAMRKQDAQNWNPWVINTGPRTPMKKILATSADKSSLSDKERPMNRSLCGCVTSDEPIHSPCWTLPKFITRCLSINLGNEVPWHYEVGDGGFPRLVWFRQFTRLSRVRWTCIETWNGTNHITMNIQLCRVVKT